MHKTIGRRDTVISTQAGVVAAAVTLLLFVCVVLRAMNYELRRDEELYVPPAILLENYRLYVDFFYNHAPGSAWWFYGVRQLTGSDYLLLNGRLAVLAAWAIYVASIGAVCYVLTRSALVSWCIVVLSVMNELFLTQTGMTATNNFLPLPFSFLGLALFILGISRGGNRPMWIAAAGGCLAIATVLKISAIAFVLPVAVAAFCLPRSVSPGRRLVHVVAPLVVGGLIGSLPVLIYLAADPARFLAHVVSYHLGPHAQYFEVSESVETPQVTSLAGKFILAYSVWLSGGIAVSLVALLALVLTLRHWAIVLRSGHWLVPSGRAMIVLGAFALSVVFSFIPTPGHPQYFALPLVCLPLGLALLFARLEADARPSAQPALVAATVVALVIAAPRLVQHLGVAGHPERWTVARVHESGVAIADRLAAAGVSGKVATLSPVYPLEGGLSVYAELATGPFAYRTADITAPEIAAFYRMTSPTRIEALFEADPPAALLLGFDPALEQPMLAYASKNGYLPATDLVVADRYGTGKLYIRPGFAN